MVMPNWTLICECLRPIAANSYQEHWKTMKKLNILKINFNVEIRKEVKQFFRSHLSWWENPWHPDT